MLVVLVELDVPDVVVVLRRRLVLVVLVERRRLEVCNDRRKCGTSMWSPVSSVYKLMILKIKFYAHYLKLMLMNFTKRN